MFIKNSDVHQVEVVQVKESQNENWEEIKTKIENDGHGILYFDYMSPRNKRLDFRILTTRKSQGCQETYLLFELRNKSVYGEYKRSIFSEICTQFVHFLTVFNKFGCLSIT